MPDSPARQIAAEVLRAIESGPPVLVATVIAAPDASVVGSKMLVRMAGTALGTLGVLDRAVHQEAGDAFRRGGVSTHHYDAKGDPIRRSQADERSYTVMLEVHERPARLLIVGGGHIGKALAEIGAMCGFHITVIDDRPEYANEERFPGAESVIRGRFDEVLAEYPVDESTYAVCVTRGHRHDEVGLRRLAGRGAAYVGMIGSKRRVSAVLQHLIDEGMDRAAVEAVHTPIGLDIGAETPEEIAVSIMAEIIGVRRGGSGKPMREVNPPR